MVLSLVAMTTCWGRQKRLPNLPRTLSRPVSIPCQVGGQREHPGGARCTRAASSILNNTTSCASCVTRRRLCSSSFRACQKRHPKTSPPPRSGQACQLMGRLKHIERLRHRCTTPRGQITVHGTWSGRLQVDNPAHTVPRLICLSSFVSHAR
jgi:hypothetical protein